MPLFSDLTDNALKIVKKIIIDDENAKKKEKDNLEPISYKLYKKFNPDFVQKVDGDYTIPLPKSVEKAFDKKLNKKQNLAVARVLINYNRAGQPFSIAIKELRDSKQFGKYNQRRFALIFQEMINNADNLDLLLKKYFNGKMDEQLINAIRIGQSTQQIEKCLNIYIEDALFKGKISKKIVGACIYPAFLCLMMIAMCLGITYGLVPALGDFLDKADKPSGLILAMNVSYTLTHPVRLVITLAVIIGILIMFKKIKPLRLFKDFIGLKIPFLNNYTTYSNLCYFFRALYFQMLANVPASQAHISALNSVQNTAIYTIIDDISDDISKGNSAIQSYAKISFLPDTLKLYLQSSLKAGKEAEALKTISDELSESLQEVTTTLVNQIPTLSLVVIAGFIAYVFLPILMLIYSIGDYV